jgi:5,5'-dehydrodivanillate O-demethylase
MAATINESPQVNAKPEDYFDHFCETKPGTLGGRYLRQFWHPIARSVDLLPGRAKSIRLLSEDFTLYRGETGSVHLTVHRCPHRKTQLSVGFVEGDAIRCIYHGWKFGGDGRCVERPGEGTTGSIAIDVYPAHEFLGLIFVYIGGGEPPAFPPFPDFTGEGIRETYATPFPCNHFQSYENDWDIFHAAYTHKTGEIHGPAVGAGRDDFFRNLTRSEQYFETDFGVVRTLKTARGETYASIFLMPLTIRVLIPAFNEQSRRTGAQMRDTYLIHTPIDDENHLVFLTQNIQLTGDAAVHYREEYERLEALRKTIPTTLETANEILAGKKTIREAANYPILVEVEDLIAHVGQGRIVDRRGELLGRTDLGVIYHRRLMARELDALANGRPTKKWEFMHELPEGASVSNPLSA